MHTITPKGGVRLGKGEDALVLKCDFNTLADFEGETGHSMQDALTSGTQMQALRKLTKHLGGFESDREAGDAAHAAIHEHGMTAFADAVVAAVKQAFPEEQAALADRPSADETEDEAEGEA